MSNIEKIKAEIERLKKWSESSKKEWIDEGYNQNAFAEDCRIKSFDKLLTFIDSLPEEASCVYDTNKLIPTPSVNIEDVARVQFASHAHVFDRKRKAVFDWEQFKEVAGIFYGFGKRNSLIEEKPTEDLEEAAENYRRKSYNAAMIPQLDGPTNEYGRSVKDAFIAGAKWQYKNTITFLSEVMFQDMKKGICGWGEIPEKK